MNAEARTERDGARTPLMDLSLDGSGRTCTEKTAEKMGIRNAVGEMAEEEARKEMAKRAMEAEAKSQAQAKARIAIEARRAQVEEEKMREKVKREAGRKLEEIEAQARAKIQTPPGALKQVETKGNQRAPLSPDVFVVGNYKNDKFAAGKVTAFQKMGKFFGNFRSSIARYWRPPSPTISLPGDQQSYEEVDFLLKTM